MQEKNFFSSLAAFMRARYRLIALNNKEASSPQKSKVGETMTRRNVCNCSAENPLPPFFVIVIHGERDDTFTCTCNARSHGLAFLEKDGKQLLQIEEAYIEC